jgi:hypothetical protein
MYAYVFMYECMYACYVCMYVHISARYILHTYIVGQNRNEVAEKKY